MSGYRNVALFGVDARDKSLGKGNRTDTIIVASINETTKEVKLVSVYRDTYLNIGNDSYNKANSAYAKGGPLQAINMLNMNLDLNITDYVTVGWAGVADTIDALGGVEIDVDESEINHLNNYQVETSKSLGNRITKLLPQACRHWTVFRLFPTAVFVIPLVMTSSVQSVREKSSRQFWIKRKSKYCNTE